MLAIRLSRIGKKNFPAFRVVVMDKRKSAQGRALETLGSVNPRSKEIVLNNERILYWLSVGAQASDRVHNILVSKEVIKDPKRAIKIKPKKKEEKPEEAAPAATEAPAAIEEPPAEPTPEAPSAEETKEAEPTTETKKETPTEEKAETEAPTPVEEKAEEKTEEKPAKTKAEKPEKSIEKEAEAKEEPKAEKK